MKLDIIRAWKDSSYRKHLTDEERAGLPENPVGLVELTDDELKAVSGGQAQTGAGGLSIGIGGCQNTSQQGTCQSVQQSTCISQQGSCKSQAAGNCNTTGAQASCNMSFGGPGAVC